MGTQRRRGPVGGARAFQGAAWPSTTKAWWLSRYSRTRTTSPSTNCLIQQYWLL